jgi:hypothetical protein
MAKTDSILAKAGEPPKGTKNPWDAAHWNLTKQMAFAKEFGLDVAREWAAAAGTTIGGPKPKIKGGKDGSPGAAGARGRAGLDASGDNGWSPELAAASDGARRVLKVADWQGGSGDKPVSGDYVGAGGLVGDIADGVDVRGAQGAAGEDAGTPFTFSTSLSGDPGIGKFALDAAPSSATRIRINKTAGDGSDVSALLVTLAANRGSIMFRSSFVDQFDNHLFLFVRLTDDALTRVGYIEIPMEIVDGVPGLENDSMTFRATFGVGGNGSGSGESSFVLFSQATPVDDSLTVTDLSCDDVMLFLEQLDGTGDILRLFYSTDGTNFVEWGDVVVGSGWAPIDGVIHIRGLAQGRMWLSSTLNAGVNDNPSIGPAGRTGQARPQAAVIAFRITAPFGTIASGQMTVMVQGAGGSATNFGRLLEDGGFRLTEAGEFRTLEIQV